jgi:hypothetical protein
VREDQERPAQPAIPRSEVTGQGDQSLFFAESTVGKECQVKSQFLNQSAKQQHRRVCI